MRHSVKKPLAIVKQTIPEAFYPTTKAKAQSVLSKTGGCEPPLLKQAAITPSPRPPSNRPQSAVGKRRQAQSAEYWR